VYVRRSVYPGIWISAVIFPGDVLDVRHVHNYVRAMDDSLDRLRVLPVSLRLICEIHAILTQGVRGTHLTPGKFRRSQNWIGPPGSTIESAAFVPPPVEEMHKVLDALEKFIHGPSDIPLGSSHHVHQPLPPGCGYGLVAIFVPKCH